MTKTAAPVPGTVRLLKSPSAVALAELMAIFDDLQTVLRCCERLMTELAGDGGPDEIVVESIWTLALLSYGRAFSSDAADTALTDKDVVTAVGHDKVLDWHGVLLALRDHHASGTTNPRERFSVGVAQDADGAPGGIAVASARQPTVDDVTVRQAGAIAFALSNVVNDRISAQQEKLFHEVRPASKADLDMLAVLDVELDA